MKTIEDCIEKLATKLHSDLVTEMNITRIAKLLSNSCKTFKISDENPFSHVEDGMGIYLIEARFPFKTLEELHGFGEKWGRAGSKTVSMNSGRYYEERGIKAYEKLKGEKFVPFYLGKQMKIKSRLIQHLTSPITSTTYGLKLQARTDILEGIQLRAAGITFNIAKDNYFCINILEAELRKIFHPIIGKQ